MPFRQVLEITVTHHLPKAGEGERQNWIEARLEQQHNAQGTHEQKLPGNRVIQITERRTPQMGMVIVYQDVTELHAATAEIEYLAFYDPLTKLPNRRLLMDRLQQAIASSACNGEFGDLLRQQVAQRLRACLREQDTVARLGGDEFVVMLSDLANHSQEAAAARHGLAAGVHSGGRRK
jgi:PleD family two-component response regulator